MTGRKSKRGSDVPPALKAHFAAHNRHVIYMALAALLGALAFWALLYGLLYGATLFFSTIVEGFGARVAPFFKEGFVASAALLCALVFLAQRRASRPPRDHKRAVEHIADILLMVPRMTLFVWSVLRAYQFLNRREMRLAWRLLQRIEKERKISVSTVPLDIPDFRTREKILIALQLAELIDFHQSELDGDILVRLRNDKARALCRRMIKLDTGAR